MEYKGMYFSLKHPSIDLDGASERLATKIQEVAKPSHLIWWQVEDQVSHAGQDQTSNILHLHQRLRAVQKYKQVSIIWKQTI